MENIRMKRFLMLFICLCLCAGLFPITAAAAPEWPSDVSIQADAGIVMDSDTGTVLYGKNMDQPYYPASITKILTALIVLEQCDLNEMVTFSHDDVYNVEAGSSSAGIDEGDVLTVRDCLYALMLASANESANALACHVCFFLSHKSICPVPFCHLANPNPYKLTIYLLYQIAVLLQKRWLH